MPADEKPVSAIEQHLRYIAIGNDDIEALRSVRGLVEQHADEFVQHFYAHLQAFEGTRALLSDKGVVARLLRGQRNYLLSLFDARFDENYYQYRRLIGQTHFRIGLDFQWYIGAYSLYLDFYMPLIIEDCKNDYKRLVKVQGAFRKATLLDMSIVLEAYHEGDRAALETSQSQVIHQEKLAAVGLLASGLAHEIGNPLASIQAVCDNQMRKSTDPQVVEKFQRIRDQVVRITGIVRQLVGYARPMPPTWQEVAIESVVESSLAIARLSRSAKNAEVRMEIKAGLPSPVGIADQLSQVFLNLFLNALDSMPEEGGVLTIRAEAGDSGSVMVSVEDNGCGIAQDDIGKLFTPFFTTKDVGKGTGLGLHVCDSILKRHGGRIAVESTAGKGSKFTVVLPVSGKAREGNPNA